MAAMDTSKPIEIFKSGTHTAMSGQTLSFSDAELAASVAAYDPAKHEAPIVVGHPRHDAPAYGWVKGVAFADGSYEAEPHQVYPAFAEMLDAKLFKKVSASFYTPDSPNNPVPGVYYLRHVAFLGAQPPAVKGLRSFDCAEGEEGVIEFADWGEIQVASLFRGLRDWVIGKFGLEEADKALPGWTVSSVEDEARTETSDDSSTNLGTAFSEVAPSTINDKGSAMSAEDKARLAELETANRKLTADLAAEQGKQRRVGFASFAEALVTEGKLLPAQRDVAVAALDALGAGEPINFGEGDNQKPLVDAFKDFLTGLPKQVDFSESATGARAAGSTGEDDANAIAGKAVAFQESEAVAGRVINTAQAVAHVTTQR